MRVKVRRRGFEAVLLGLALAAGAWMAWLLTRVDSAPVPSGDRFADHTETVTNLPTAPLRDAPEDVQTSRAAVERPEPESKHSPEDLETQILASIAAEIRAKKRLESLPTLPKMPDTDFMLSAEPEQVMSHPVFQFAFGDDVAQRPHVLQKVAGILGEVRQHYSQLHRDRDRLTSDAVQVLLDSGFRPVPDSTPGGLGAIVGGPHPGWVPIPSDAEAYKVQQVIDVWSLMAVELILRSLQQ